MNHRLGYLPLVVILTYFGCSPPSSPAAPPEADTRPNVLFILTDDQGIGDLSLHGNDSIRTPNMDALLASSVRFTRFYVSPVCAPTRASFLSGQYAPRTGAVFVTRRLETMHDGVTTLPEYLRQAGYRTGLFGKWHNGATFPYHPAGQGFDEFLGFTLGHFNDYFSGELRNERDEAVPFAGDLTQILTDTASHWMRNGGEAPFFAMLAYQAPHTPVQVADPYYDAVADRGLTDYNTGIYAMIESVDDRIGQLMNDLERSGLLENTIVIFSTDNGPNGNRYRMGLRGTKGHIDEGGVRVPFGIRLPGSHRMNGKTVELPAAHVDVLPTLLDYTKIEFTNEENFDGVSLQPLLEFPFDQGTSPGDPLDSLLRFYHFRPIYTFRQGERYDPDYGSVRNSRYLYVTRGTGRREFYDLLRDTSQLNDLWGKDTFLMHQYAEPMAEEYHRFAREISPPDSIVGPPIDLDAAPGEIRLLAHEGEARSTARFSDRYGWANDWLVNMGAATWPITTQATVAYTITLKYHVAGMRSPYISVSVAPGNGHHVDVTLPYAQSIQLPVPDRYPRKEVYPRDWAEYTLPTQLTIPAGTQELTVGTWVNGDNPPGMSPWWLKEVVLRPVAR